MARTTSLVTDYSLSIEIDTAGLTKLGDSQQLVCLAQGFLFPPDPFVVWLAFPPSESATITWSDSDVAVYSAGILPVAVGQVIEVASQLPAVAGGLYGFEGGQFRQTGTGGAGSFTIANGDSSFPHLTAGIARPAAGAPTIVPGQALPLVAQIVPNAERGVFQPTEKLTIFAASNLRTSVLVPASLAGIGAVVVSGFLAVDFSQSPSQTVHFDDSANQFESGSLPST